MAPNNKIKGLLKGLKYISQIFENEDEEPEMQIGLPTDVKHVAHIGSDGSSVNPAKAPSWMNEFKSGAPAAAPEHLANGEVREEEPTKVVSQEVPRSSKRSSSAHENGDSSVKEKREKVSRSLNSSPKSSRRSSSASANGECTKEKRDKPKQPKKPSSSDTSSRKPRKVPRDPSQVTESNLTSEDDSKKSIRRKRPKDAAAGNETSSQVSDARSSFEEGITLGA
ncbi:hypothetical protein HRI_001284400 [Hibiscus trionum]|uniref:CRIB domain-containing protein n=1 Tax=Hibiscus trionum TaxID=183268 RepID=A0A9W7HF59_HIBTR|nr:hypothetical protein HRI_001284400 [Hibiscus trionum]